jgi:pimeloyl-ACP methyl ester carboxylesterase
MRAESRWLVPAPMMPRLSSNRLEVQVVTQVVSPPSPAASAGLAPVAKPPGNRPAALPAWQRLRWQAGSLVSPSATARAFERLWFTPPRAAPTSAARRFLDTARSDWALVTGHGPSRRVRVYRWGDSGPAVLLAHGWGGHAGQWHAVAGSLVAAGMRVVAFDALSHGASDAGTRGAAQTSVLEMSRSLLAAAWHAGPVHAVVAHSLGGAATALALREGLPARAAVLVGSPADMHAACTALAWQLGIAPAVLARMQRQSERWLGMPWSAFNVPEIGRSRPVPPTLVIHDRGDKEVRWEDGAAIAGAWPGAELVTTDGLGHRRILQDPAVIGRIAAFVRPSAAGTVTAPPAALAVN